MSLIDQLRESAAALPPSHIPTPAEALGVLGALIAHSEFGDRFLDAAKEEDPTPAIDRLLSPDSDQPDLVVPEPQSVAAPTAAVPPAAADVRRQVPIEQSAIAPAPVLPSSDVAPSTSPAGAENEIAQLRAELAQRDQEIQNLVAARDRTQVDVTPATEPNQGPAV